PIATTTPDALSYYLIPENRALLSSLSIMTDREIVAYYETRLEQYVKTLDVEMAVMEDMIRHAVLPSISKQVALEGKTFERATSILDSNFESWKGKIKSLCDIKEQLYYRLEQLRKLRNKISNCSLEESSSLITNEGISLMNEIRSLSDAAELWIDDMIQPYPSYRDLLVIQ
ncbi:MAG: glutamine synthetase type III, partial [Acetomicrobium sp.]|nr:glutamine synthetase type III [Acetomicrobium sp.]